MKRLVPILLLIISTQQLFSQQIPNMNFDSWNKRGVTWYPYAEGASGSQKAWDSANPGLKPLGTNATMPEYKHVAVAGPGKAAANIVTGLSCGYASLEAIPAGYVIPKGTGVLVKGSANTTYAFNGSASDVSGKTRASVSGNLLKGVLTSTNRPSGTCRVLSAESTDALAAFGDFTGSAVAANTAYLAR